MVACFLAQVKKKAHFRPCFNIPNGISGNFINRQVKNLELDLLEKVKANIGFKFFKGFLSDPQVWAIKLVILAKHC